MYYISHFKIHYIEFTRDKEEQEAYIGGEVSLERYRAFPHCMCCMLFLLALRLALEPKMEKSDFFLL